MSAEPPSGCVRQPIKTLGIVAGGGALPHILAQACDARGIHPFIVGIEGQVEPETLEGRDHVIFRLGLAGKMIEALKANGAMDLVLIGSVKRPSISSLRPDLKTAGFFAKLGLKALGDNDMLKAVRQELEKDGFQIHGVHEFVAELLAPEGIIGKHRPSRQDEIDIERGLSVSQALGRLDVGQSVIVQNGIVLGLEAAEGTDRLIARCKDYKKKEKGGVLVKSCKPQQDQALDLPTIGPETVQACADAGLSGIAVHAHHSLIADLEQVKNLADEHKLFVIGVEYP